MYIYIFFYFLGATNTGTPFFVSNPLPFLIRCSKIRYSKMVWLCKFQSCRSCFAAEGREAAAREARRKAQSSGPRKKWKTREGRAKKSGSALQKNRVLDFLEEVVNEVLISNSSFTLLIFTFFYWVVASYPGPLVLAGRILILAI